MSLLSDAKATVAKFLINMGRFDQIMNGDKNTDVTVDVGTIPTLRKLFDYIVANVVGVVVKGSVNTINDLPSSGNKIGDIYIVTSASSNNAANDGYVWTGSQFRNIGPIRGPKGDIGPRGDSTDYTLNLLTFGAKDDDFTNNTVNIQTAINKASTEGRTLFITRSNGGTGKYRTGSLDFKNVILEIDESAGFSNLDGTPYSGPSFHGTGVLPGRLSPYLYQRGGRSSSPYFEYEVANETRVQNENTLVTNYNDPFPYAVSGQIRNFILHGANSPSSGSLCSATIYQNIYNVSNGPGIEFEGDFLHNSQYIGNVTPDPTGINPANGVGLVFHPARIICSVTGVPINTFAKSWNGDTFEMASGSDETVVGFTGTTGRYKFRVVSGRSEFNGLSLSIGAIGTATAGGPQGGMNWYQESTMRSAISTKFEDQEGFLAAWLCSATKTSPGEERSKLHNGSCVISAVARIDDTGQRALSYPLEAGISVTGWSGNPDDAPAGGWGQYATPGARQGIHIGGVGKSVYASPTARSFFENGLLIEDYQTAIRIQNGHPTRLGDAIYIADTAGSITIGDYIVERRSLPPTTLNSPGVTGQRAWDQNYEYRCVAPNRWRRIPFAADWP